MIEVLVFLRQQNQIMGQEMRLKSILFSIDLLDFYFEGVVFCIIDCVSK